MVWGRFPNREEQRAAEATVKDWVSMSPKVPGKSEHETPKPEAFAQWVLDVSLGPRSGDVCELFAGTAPVARLAHKLGMDSVGVDLVDYVNGNMPVLIGGAP